MGLVLALLDRPRRAALGGGPRLVASTVLETLFSAMLAPVMMLFHTGFVLQILVGSAIDWKPQRRQAGASALAETARRFGWVTVLGLAATAASAWATPELFYWLIPVLAGLVFAIPLGLLSGDERLGDRLRALRLLPVVEEACPPPVMRRPGPAPACRWERRVAGPLRGGRCWTPPSTRSTSRRCAPPARRRPCRPRRSGRPSARRST
jgi:membrane glycosyltransferase